jgi:hypothetical protein
LLIWFFCCKFVWCYLHYSICYRFYQSRYYLFN